MSRHLLSPALAPALALVLALLPAGSAAAAPAEPPPSPARHGPGPVRAPEVTDRLIVKFSAPVPAAERDRVLRRSARAADVAEGAGAVELHPGVGGSTVLRLTGEVPAAAAARLAGALAREPAVAWAEPDRLVSAAAAPDDPHYPHQWGMQRLDVPAAWSTATGAGVVIGVVDSGITRHPDLDATSAGGHDFVSDPALSNDGGGRDDDPTDAGTYAVAGQCSDGSAAQGSSWHGTHVAGGTVVDAGTHPGTGTVTARAEPGHVLAEGAVDSWTHAFDAGTAPYTPPATSPFADVPTGHPFYREIAWMAERGISGGWVTPEGTKEYRPHLAVHRDVMAAFLHRAAG